QTADHAAEFSRRERQPRRASVHEPESRDALDLRVPLALRLRVLPVPPPEVEPDVFAGAGLCEPDEQLSASAAHVQQATSAVDRVDQELMNPRLEAATPPSESIGRQREYDRDVQERKRQNDQR